MRWVDNKREYAAFKKWKEGKIPFQQAYQNSVILRRIIARILANEGLKDDEAYGVASLYRPYSTMDVIRRLEEEGLITLKRIQLNAGTTRIIARPASRLYEVLGI